MQKRLNERVLIKRIGNMNKVFVLFLALISFGVDAKDVRIKVEPLKPVYKEPYQIKVVIRTDSSTEPQISFTPINIEVISKAQTGTQTQASFVNGKTSITKSITYTYEVVSNRFGTAYMKDIKIDTGSRTLSHPTVRISVLQQAAKNKNIFVRAEVDKEQAYVGESIIVRYYLYNRSDIPITSTDVKKFPKLDKFLKRFHQEQVNPKRVNLGGKIYTRRVMYTAQLFAQQPGLYRIDPISLRVGYSKRRDPFSNFGFNLRLGGTSKTTAMSAPVEIEALALPVDSMPSNFSGIVGRNEFSVKMNKNKFLVNEPIEIVLNIKGDGAFELFDAPAILPFAELEEFEKNSDLTIYKDFTAQKKVEYTYLGRSNLDIKNHNVTLSYFDTDAKSYKEVTLAIGDLKVVGGSARSKTPNDKSNLAQTRSNDKKNIISTPVEEPFELKPFYKPVNTILFNAKEVSLFIASLIAILGLVFSKRLYFWWKKNQSNEDVFKKIYRDGLSYHLFLELFENLSETGDIRVKIKQLEISESAQQHLLDVLDQLNTLYFEQKSEQRIKIKKKFFKELEKLIKSENEIIYEL